MLEYLYTDIYTCSDSTASQAIFHMDVNAVADYYQIDGLLKLSEDNLGDFLSALTHAEQLPVIVKAATEKQVDRKLQSLVASASARFMESLIDNPDFTSLDLPNDFRNLLFQACASRIAHMKSATAEVQAKLNASLQSCNSALRKHPSKSGA
ncbi:unnamed protein product, partial [Clonostachys rosea f. rosea IK726]